MSKAVPKALTRAQEGSFSGILRDFSSWKQRDFFLLVLMMLAGFGFRMSHMDEKSLGVDEILTIAHALGNLLSIDTLNALGLTFDPESPQSVGFYQERLFHSNGIFNWGATAKVLLHNNHPPLYFWLMNWVIHQFGHSVTALRMPSVVFGVLSIPMMYLLGRRLHSSNLGLLAAIMVTCSGYQIYHAQNARPYMMVTFLAITQAWFLIRALTLKAPSREGHFEPNPAMAWFSWFGFTACGVLGMYTHYFYAPFLVGVGVWGLVVSWRSPRLLAALVGSVVVMGLGYLTWFPALSVQLSWVKEIGHYTNHSRWGWIQLPEIIWRVLNTQLAPKDGLFPIANIILAIYSLGIFYWMRNNERRPSPLMLFSMLWLLAILLFQVGFDVVQDASTLTVKRYTLLAAPAFYLMLSCALLNAETRERLPHVMIMGAFIGLMVFNAYQIVNQKEYVSSEFRQAVQWVTSHGLPGDTVLVNKSGEHTAAIAYYLPKEGGIKLLGIPARSAVRRKERAQFDVRINNAAKGGGRLWFVLSQPAETAKLAIDANLAHKKLYLDHKKQFHGDLEVRLYSPTSKILTPPH